MSDGAVPAQAALTGQSLLDRIGNAGVSIAETLVAQQAAKSAVKKYAPSQSTVLIVGGVAVAGILLLVFALKK